MSGWLAKDRAEAVMREHRRTCPLCRPTLGRSFLDEVPAEAWDKAAELLRAPKPDVSNHYAQEIEPEGEAMNSENTNEAMYAVESMARTLESLAKAHRDLTAAGDVAGETRPGIADVRMSISVLAHSIEKRIEAIA